MKILRFLDKEVIIIQILPFSISWQICQLSVTVLWDHFVSNTVFTFLLSISCLCNAISKCCAYAQCTFLKAAAPRERSWTTRNFIHEVKLVVHNHESWLATMVHNGLPGSVSAASIYGDLPFAREARVARCVCAVMPSRPSQLRFWRILSIRYARDYWYRSILASSGIWGISWCPRSLYQFGRNVIEAKGSFRVIIQKRRKSYLHYGKTAGIVLNANNIPKTMGQSSHITWLSWQWVI